MVIVPLSEYMITSVPMKLLRGNLPGNGERLVVRGTLFDIGIHDQGKGSTPVEVELRAKVVDEDILLEGHIATALKLTCDRCLADVDYPLKGTLRIWLVTEPRPDFDLDRAIIIELNPHQDAVDLSEVIAESIHLGVPQKMLCHEDCKGLCPACGTDWNQQLCECNNETVDERWSVLLKLKQNLKDQ